MTIATLADFDAAAKLRVVYYKPAFNTNCNNNGPWGDKAVESGGDPGAVALVANTTTGVVPTMATAGYPQFETTSGTAFLTNVEGISITPNAGTFLNTATRILIYDKLFECGPFVSGHAAYSLSGQPSFAARLPPSGYNGLMLWLANGGNTSVGGTGTVTVGYLNESGAAKTTSWSYAGTQAGAGFNCCQMLPLAAGDKGIQTVTSVDPSGLTNPGNNSYNLFIIRPLFMGYLANSQAPNVRNVASYSTGRYGMDLIGMPRIYPNSAIGVMQHMANGTSFDGLLDIIMEIAVG